MKIDRSNYEIWFIDWLDGFLNDDQVVQFKMFLSENPDLKEELNDLADIRIVPPAVDFSGKRVIRKAPSDISALQFEYLCAAYIENDLSEDELKELDEITTESRDRQQVLELFEKLKLDPPDLKYKYRKRLLKRTPVQKVIRMTVAVLGAAASVAILVTMILSGPGNDRIITENLSQSIINEGRVSHPGPVQQTVLPVASKPQLLKAEYSETRPSFDNKLTAMVDSPERKILNIEENSAIQVNTEVIQPVKVPGIPSEINFNNNNTRNYELISMSFSQPAETEERWVVGRFFAKTFREKILREKTFDDSPIRGYEIAEAGVTGLNKLLGWQMAFEKNNDENGEIRSVNFNSKLLKIQAPVNKTGSSE